MLQTSLNLAPPGVRLGSIVSPWREMGAYECMWASPTATARRIADKFRQHPGALPSDFVNADEASKMADWVGEHFERAGIRPRLRVHTACEYPERLRDARDPVEVLHYRGYWELTELPGVAVVGTRKPTEEGRRRVRQLVPALLRSGFVIVSGLAEGIDTEAHEAALREGGQTIAVLGTPLSTCYPKQNQQLQEHLAREHLIVSEVPVYRYTQHDYRANRIWFPARNKTMSALTHATIIVEASDTSGTLIQARAALAQRRRLFILNSCFDNPNISWPARFEQQGAIRVRTVDDILGVLARDLAKDGPPE